LGWLADVFFGEPHLLDAKRFQRRAHAARVEGRREEAVQLQREAVALFRKVVDRRPEFAGRLAAPLRFLGILLADGGDRAAAVAPLTEAAAAFRTIATRDRRFLRWRWDALFRLGVQQLALARYEDALATCAEAVTVCRRLEGTNWRNPLATSLENLAFCQSTVGKEREAHETMLEALAIYRQLAEDGKPATTALLAKGFALLSGQENALGLSSDALRSAEVAVDLFETVDAAVTLEGQYAFGTALLNLGTAQESMGRHDDALETAAKAVEHHRKFAGANRFFRETLANSLLTLGAQQTRHGLFEAALRTNEEAVTIWRRVAAESPAADPGKGLIGVASALGCLGLVQGNAGQVPQALASADEALELKRRMPDQKAAWMESSLVGTLTNLLVIYARAGRREDALQVGVEATAFARTRAAASPAAGLPMLALAINNLCIAQHALGLRREALATGTEGLALSRTLAAEDPRRHQDRLAQASTNLALAEAHLGMKKDALEHAAEAVSLRRRPSGESADSMAGRLVFSLINLSWRQHDLGLFDQALASASEAIVVRREFEDKLPATVSPTRAEAVLSSARARRALGAVAEAIREAMDAVASLRELVAVNPGAFTAQLGTALHELACAQASHGRPDEALAAAREAIDILRRLVAKTRVRFIADLAEGLHDFAPIYAAAGWGDDARAAANEAVTLYEELARAYPEAFAEKLAAARQRHAAL
jgi:tetratricopeptide (TPR) repeat protein